MKEAEEEGSLFDLDKQRERERMTSDKNQFSDASFFLFRLKLKVV